MEENLSLYMIEIEGVYNHTVNHIYLIAHDFKEVNEKLDKYIKDNDKDEFKLKDKRIRGMEVIANNMNSIRVKGNYLTDLDNILVL